MQALCYSTAQSRSFAYVGPVAWSGIEQSICLELLALSNLQFWRRLKIFLFAGSGTHTSRERCWLEWCYTCIWLHYITWWIV